MIRSLRARLMLTTVLLLFVLIALLSFAFGRITTKQIEHLTITGETQQAARLVPLLSAHWKVRHSWQGVEPLLAGFEQMNGRPVLLVSEGRVVAASSGDLVGASAVPDIQRRTTIRKSSPRGEILLLFRGESGIVRDSSGTVRARLFVLRERGPGESVDALRQVRLWLAGAAVVAALAGMAGLIAVSRSITQPLEELTAQVRRLESGDVLAKVAVRSRDEIGELAEAFNDLAARLETTERLRRDLVSDVAHELRTPLSNMRGEVEAAQDGLRPLSPDLLESLHQELLILSRLVADLQHLAVADAGQMSLERGEVDVSTLLARSVAFVSAGALKKGITVTTTANEITIPGDCERLVQVLRNLLDNALQHTSEGGHIEVRAERRGTFAEIVVRDDGEGIATDDLPFVFERFFRADRSRSRNTGGAGLGLAIAKNIVQLHGGTIRVESSPEGGSTFIVSLPLA